MPTQFDQYANAVVHDMFRRIGDNSELWILIGGPAPTFDTRRIRIVVGYQADDGVINFYVELYYAVDSSGNWMGQPLRTVAGTFKIRAKRGGVTCPSLFDDGTELIQRIADAMVRSNSFKCLLGTMAEMNVKAVIPHNDWKFEETING